MDILRLNQNVKLQEAGIWHDILDPISGIPTGMRLKIVGPDSKQQKMLRFELEDWLTPKNNYNASKRRSAQEKDEAIVQFLAGTIVDWEAEEDGKPVPFTKMSAVRILHAATWLRAQVDTLANYYPPWTDPKTAREEEHQALLEKAKQLQDEMEKAANPDAEEVDPDADTQGQTELDNG